MKAIVPLIFFILIMGVSNLNSQNTCSGAIPITETCFVPNDQSLTLSYNSSNCSEFGGLPPDLVSDIWFTLSLSEATTYAFSSSDLHPFAIAIAEIFTGSCNNLTYLSCSEFPSDTSEIILPSGLITIRVIYQNDLQINLCMGPAGSGTGCTNQIDPPQNVTACNQYTLPPITGTNLTGNQAYYSGSGGTGTMYAPGEIIDISSILFAYDSDGTCSAEESFEILIENEGSLFQSNNILPIQSSWFGEFAWGFTTEIPAVCDDVIIQSGSDIVVDAHPESAVCRTLEVELGADFEVQLVLIVGN